MILKELGFRVYGIGSLRGYGLGFEDDLGLRV